jgi:hypothetical protein
MPIGQAGERDNLRDSTRIERVSLMRTRSTDPIMASGPVPRTQAGHMNVPDPISKTPVDALAQRGPSTHESQYLAQGNPKSQQTLDV